MCTDAVSLCVCVCRQVDGLPGIQIWGKLYHVNDSEPSERHNWHIHRDRVRHCARLHCTQRLLQA